MKGYIGSVRFFKNLILLTVIVAIIIPSVFAARYRSSTARLEEQLEQMEQHNALVLNGVSELTAEAVASGSSIPYQALYPDFYAPEHADTSKSSRKTAYLTFDDGPSDRTDEVLDILAEEEVRATFFVVGLEDEASLARMKRIVEEGHTLGMHSYSHDYKEIYHSVESYLEDMYRLFSLIRETTGEAPTVFRMPGGSLNAYNYGIYQELLAEMLRRGFVPCDWSLSAGDVEGVQLTARDIVDNVVDASGQMDRCFILMHDDKDNATTVEALPEMIQVLRQQGFALEAMTPETTPVLFGYRK